MSDGSEHIREFLRKQVVAIDKEVTRLQGALSSLDGGAPTKPRRPKQGPKARRSGSKRAARGQRPKQFLAAVKASPRATVAEIAKEIGVSTAHARTLARRLQAKGEIKQSKQGFRLTAGAK